MSRHRAFGKKQKHPEVDRIDGTCLPAQGYNLDLSGGRTLLLKYLWDECISFKSVFL